MTTARSTGSRLTLHRLTTEVRICGSGEGFDVDAGCACPAGRTGERPWTWAGWGATPTQALDQAAEEWADHMHRAGWAAFPQAQQ